MTKESGSAGPAGSPRVPIAQRSSNPLVRVIIPVLNEEEALPKVLADIPKPPVVEVIVVDNGSTDRSADVARSRGATVVHEPRRGYGAACLRGIASLKPCDIVVFRDGDYSDYPEDLPALIAPIFSGEAHMVIGSRMIHRESRRALLPQSRFGNRLASWLLRLFFGIRCTDLGPFRALDYKSLLGLGMKDQNFGWTVEMQLRARLFGLSVEEIPVRYRPRIGKSKITGTFSGTVRASIRIIQTILIYRLRPPRKVAPSATTVT